MHLPDTLYTSLCFTKEDKESVRMSVFTSVTTFIIRQNKLLTCMLLRSFCLSLYRNRTFPVKTLKKLHSWGSATKETKQTFLSCFSLTLKSWTPMQANIKSRSMVTSTMFPMVLTATNTHWTTCYRGREMMGRCEIWWAHQYFLLFFFFFFSRHVFTFSPLALLMALRGLRTLKTLKIFTTEIALDLQKHMTSIYQHQLICFLWDD